jgi:hypothetical protein
MIARNACTQTVVTSSRCAGMIVPFEPFRLIEAVSGELVIDTVSEKSLS